MKHAGLILVIALFAVNANCQSFEDRSDINFLNWLVKSEKIDTLFATTEAGTLNSKQLQSADVVKFLSKEELASLNSQAALIKKRRWRKIQPKLKVTDLINADAFVIGNSTIYSLSEPIFLNDDHSRVVISLYFVSGMACGRGDVLLFEYKDGKWVVVKRSNIWNS